jgi:hypothetical protein
MLFVSARALRPLCSVQTSDERIYQISRIIEGVAACLHDLTVEPDSFDYFYAIELSGRLEFVVDSLRLMSDAN